jgi:predicted GTPase
MGAAGRDFHNFNACFRDDPAYEVVAFTAAQIPNIEGRRYPAALAGSRYAAGIPIYPESELARLVREKRIDQVIFAYSDAAHADVMHKASAALAAGADFRLLGPRATMLKSSKPVVAVCAVRTGAGKSQTTRRVIALLKTAGLRAVAVRHPMPYGDLARQAVQRFASYDDLARHDVTIEEREEYEPHLANGTIVYAGVDYERILRAAEAESDVVVWDGGNNDFPFFAPDLLIVVADPLRAGHEAAYHPGETNLRMADVVVVNKVDAARPEDLNTVYANIRRLNPSATVIDAASPVTVDDPAAIAGKRVLVVEDGPTLTHGEMAYGAGVAAARRFGAAQIVDPRPWAVGTIAATYAKYPATGAVLPAMGYSADQVRDLEATIEAAGADLVLIATPIDLLRLITIRKPCQRVGYELQEIGRPALADVMQRWLARRVTAALVPEPAPVHA